MEFLASFLSNNSALITQIRTRYFSLTSTCMSILDQLKAQLSRCDLCNNRSRNGKLICSTCLQDCPHFTLPNGTHNLLLWPAVDKIFMKRSFDQLLCYAPYIWPYDAWLKQFKYNARFELAPLLAQLLTLCWQAHLKQLSDNKLEDKSLLIGDAVGDIVDDTVGVVSVPIHLTKWQTRGFNQAHLMAKHFAKANRLPYLSNLLKRVKKGESQVGQSGAQRRKNLAKAFEITTLSAINYRHIVLIDDVITTGTTVNEISRLLKKNGVEKVTVLTLALSLPTQGLR